MVYQTSSPTALSGKLMFSFSPDCRYLDSRGYTSFQRYLGEFDLARIACTKTFPVYNNVRFNIPLENRGPLKWIRSLYGISSVPFHHDGFVTADSSEDRDCMYGMFMMTSNVPSTTANGTQFGDLYMETTVELCDLASQITSTVSLAVSKDVRRLRKMLEQVRILDAEDAKSKQVEDEKAKQRTR